MCDALDVEPRSSLSGPDVDSCPQCAYNLTGLELPHRCPECGFLVDPVANHQVVVAWYASLRGLLFRSPPPGVLSHLGDPACRAGARRRLLGLVLIPCLTLTALILVLDAVVLVKRVESWVEDPVRPGVRMAVGEESYAQPLLGSPPLPNCAGYLAMSPRLAVRQRLLGLDAELHRPGLGRMTRTRLILPFVAPLAGAVLLAIWRRTARGSPARALRAAMVPAMAFFGPWYVVALGGLAFGLGLHALTSTSVPASIRLGQPSSHAVLVALLSPVVLYGVGGALTFARIVRIGRPELYGAAWLVHCALLTGGWIALHGATLVALFLAAQSMA